MKKDNSPIILIDAFSVIHRSYHALPNLTTKDGKLVGAVYGFISTILKSIDFFSPKLIVACFDSNEPTHRHAVYEDYKAGRKEMDEEFHSQVEIIREACNALGVLILEKGGHEADDIIGTLSKKYKEKNQSVIIITIDQDLLQLVDDGVDVWLFRKGIKEIELLDKKKVKEFLGFSHLLLPDYKALAGDASDNIKGVVGIGKKTATELILKYGNIDNIYSAVNKENFPFTPRIQKLLKESKKDAFFSKELATIHYNVPLTLPKQFNPPIQDKEMATAFFDSLEFRTFTKKIKGNGVSTIKKPIKKDEKTKEFLEAAIAFWILNSEKTNPSGEDILEENQNI